MAQPRQGCSVPDSRETQRRESTHAEVILRFVFENIPAGVQGLQGEQWAQEHGHMCSPPFADLSAMRAASAISQDALRESAGRYPDRKSIPGVHVSYRDPGSGPAEPHQHEEQRLDQEKRCCGLLHRAGQGCDAV